MARNIRVDRRESAIRPRLSPQDLGVGRLFEHVRDAVVIADRDGMIVLWNSAAETLFGWTAEEIIGRSVRTIVPDRMRERHDVGMHGFHETGSGRFIRSGSILELPGLRKDGREIAVELSLSRIDEPGPYVMAIVRDVTERARMRAAVDADRRRLREANEALESFAYVVGHDLKEPVRAVDVYLEALAEEVHGEDAQALISTAREANRRMRVLLEGLLEWSHATITPLDLESIDLAAILRGPCRARYQQMASERGARIEIAGDLPRVMGTEGLLCQVFGNIVLNAVRHNPAPSPRVSIHLAKRTDGFAVIAVRDNGPGIPPEVRQRVERMRVTRPSTVRGGFGMTIALRATHLLGGRLELDEAPGGGAEVRIWLKLAEE